MHRMKTNLCHLQVSVESVLSTFKENGEKAMKILLTVIPRLAESKEFDWPAILQENQVSRRSILACFTLKKKKKTGETSS